MRTWLREARINKGYTMAVLSRELGISESYYCSIEGGTRQVKMDLTLATQLSKILGISLKRITQLEDEKRVKHS